MPCGKCVQNKGFVAKFGDLWRNSGIFGVKFSYQTAVMVTEKKSPRGERATAEAIENGFLTEADLRKGSEKPSNMTENGQKNGHEKRSDLTIFGEKPSKKPSNLAENDEGKQTKFKNPEFPSKMVEDVYKALKLNRKAKYSWLQDNLGVSESTILRAEETRIYRPRTLES